MNSEEMKQLIDSIRKDGLNIEIKVNGRKIEVTREDLNRILRSFQGQKLSGQDLGSIFSFAGHDWIVLEQNCGSVKCLSLNIVGYSNYGLSPEFRRDSDRNLCYENSSIRKNIDYYAREMKSKCDPSKVKYVGLLPRDQYLKSRHLIDRYPNHEGEHYPWWLADRFYPQTRDERESRFGREKAYDVVSSLKDGEPELSWASIDTVLGIRLYGIFSGDICI